MRENTTVRCWPTMPPPAPPTPPTPLTSLTRHRSHHRHHRAPPLTCVTASQMYSKCIVWPLIRHPTHTTASYGFPSSFPFRSSDCAPNTTSYEPGTSSTVTFSSRTPRDRSSSVQPPTRASMMVSFHRALMMPMRNGDPSHFLTGRPFGCGWTCAGVVRVCGVGEHGEEWHGDVRVWGASARVMRRERRWCGRGWRTRGDGMRIGGGEEREGYTTKGYVSWPRHSLGPVTMNIPSSPGTSLLQAPVLQLAQCRRH